MALAKAVAWQAPERLQYAPGANGAIADTFLFTADADYQLVSVVEVHDVAGSDGGSVTLDVVACASGTTVASGTSMLASTFNLKSTADTPVSKTVSNGGVLATEAGKLLEGQSLALNFDGTLTSLAGIGVTITLKPLTRPSW